MFRIKWQTSFTEIIITNETITILGENIKNSYLKPLESDQKGRTGEEANLEKLSTNL